MSLGHLADIGVVIVAAAAIVGGAQVTWRKVRPVVVPVVEMLWRKAHSGILHRLDHVERRQDILEARHEERGRMGRE